MDVGSECSNRHRQWYLLTCFSLKPESFAAFPVEQQAREKKCRRITVHYTKMEMPLFGAEYFFFPENWYRIGTGFLNERYAHPDSVEATIFGKKVFDSPPLKPVDSI